MHAERRHTARQLCQGQGLLATIRRVRREGAWAAGLALGAAVLTGGGTYGYYELFPSGRSLPGTRIGDRIQPGEEALGDWLERRRVALLDREVYLRLPDETVSLRFGDLGIELDVAATMRRVREHAEAGSPSQRLYRSLSARKGEQEIELSWSLDETKARSVLATYAGAVYRDPVDAKLDLVNKRRVDDQPGEELDVTATIDALKATGWEDTALVQLQTRPVAAQITSDMIADIDVSKVLGAFETDFGGTGKGRAINIKRGAEFLNGVVLAPGQMLSFNRTVGKRTLERGFTWAPVIIDDELRPGVGGGICQLASTLHAAAVYGGMDIVSRRSHSRPSSYIKLGLDATVIYGEVDLKIKNPYHSPIILHAYHPKPTVVRIELLGIDAPGTPSYSYAVIRTYDFYRRVTTKPWMGDRRVKKQRGRPGLDVFSIVKLTAADGTVREHKYRSGYRPVPEVFWVGDSFDIANLPELPDRAKSVEVDGIEIPDEYLARGG